jgi:hypothetical protein
MNDRHDGITSWMAIRETVLLARVETPIGASDFLLPRPNFRSRHSLPASSSMLQATLYIRVRNLDFREVEKAGELGFELNPQYLASMWHQISN